MKCEAMRLPFFFSLASLFLGVMVGVIAPVNAGEYEDARKLLDAQKWSEALPLLKELSDEEPDSAIIAGDLAQVLLRLNRREEALEQLKKHHLNRQAEIAGKTFLSKEGFHFYQQGLDWLTKRSYAQACERFEKALEKDQGHFEVLLRLAQCETLDGNAELSLKLLDTLDRIYGKTNETQLWRAHALGLRGRTDEAAPIFAALATVKLPEPNLEWNALWWGEALVAGNQKPAAALLFENDAKKYPTHLHTELAALRLRALNAESPNQFLAIERDLDLWSIALERRKKEKKKPTADYAIDLFDADALMKSAGELRAQFATQLPSPTPTPSASNR